MKLLFSFAFLTLPLWSFAAETSSQGELRLEFRGFQNDDNPLTQDFGGGMAGRLQVSDVRGGFSSKLQAFSRVDRKDSQRQRLNLEELYTQYEVEAFEFFLGWKTLNWSTAEAFHPTDVVNSRNFDSNIENAEKLGEFMVGSSFVGDQFGLSVFYMPLLTRPQLPGSSNRLSFIPSSVPTNPLRFLNNEGVFQESDDLADQWGVRAQYMAGDFEMNLAWVHHFDRTDIKVLNTGAITPVMTPVDHFGLGANWVVGSWILKTEMVYRDFQDSISVGSAGTPLLQRDYGLVALATEYLMPHESGAESTLIIEYQDLIGVDSTFRYGITPFQRDLLFGWRYAFNDAYGKEILLSTIADVERSRELLVAASYSQRLSDVWKIKTSLRYVDAAPQGPFDVTGIRQLNNDHQINLEISRFF